jgi:hypothetical protein
MDNNKYEYTLSLDGMPTAIGHLKKECGMTPENTYRDNDGSNSIRPVK